MSTATKISITILIIGIIGIIGGISFISLQSSPKQIPTPIPETEEISQDGGQDLVISGSPIRVKAAEGKCLGIAGKLNSLKNGIVPQFFPCDDRSNQKWNYNTNENTITPMDNSNFCLDVPGSKANNGKKLIMWSCNKGKNQDWSISNKQLSTHLNESKCATYNSAGKLELQDCASNDKQIFY